jgi:hypothetical protein
MEILIGISFTLVALLIIVFIVWLGEKIFGSEITKNIGFALLVVAGIYKCIDIDKRTHNNDKKPKTKIIKKLIKKKEINTLRDANYRNKERNRENQLRVADSLIRVADSLKKEWKK